MSETPKTLRELIVLGEAYLRGRAVADPRTVCELLAARLFNCGRLGLHPHLDVVPQTRIVDALRANAVVGASQKGLMCPPGIGFVAVDAAALAVAARNAAPRYYWDWGRRKSDLAYRKFCGTAPQNLLMGLEAALGLIFDEGLENVFSRHRLIADAVHAAVTVQRAIDEGRAALLCRQIAERIGADGPAGVVSAMPSRASNSLLAAVRRA